MKKYRHLFFDLDHTLWDYDKNVKESLSELFISHQLVDCGIVDCASFIDAFFSVNFDLWKMYDLGEIDKRVLRDQRFKLIFEKAGVFGAKLPVGLEEDFIQITSAKPHLLPYTIEILDYLFPHYKLHIITNGFNESQAKKIKSSGLTAYFDLIVTSETTGHKKPDPRIFQYALNYLEVEPQDCLMIGDNPISDIQGAFRSNIDQVFFDPHGRRIDHQPTYTIRHLRELETFL